MQNQMLDDYMDELKRQVRHLPLAEQRQVLGDVRAHLEEDIQGRRSEDKRLTADEAVLQATHAFGDPSDIGVAYGARGGVVRKSTGEILLHVAVLTGRGVARTVGKTVKWTGIAVGALLLVGVIVTLVILVAYHDTISHGVDTAIQTRQVYSFQMVWSGTDAHSAVQTDSFQTTANSRLDLRIQTSPNTGCVAIQLTAPDGSIAYQNGQGCSMASQQLSFTQPGTWNIRYTYVAYTGSVGVQGIESPQA